MARQIQARIGFNGSAEHVLDAARDTFVRNNFRIVTTTPTNLEVLGPGMNSNHEDPLVGISRARLEANGHELSATAELGGVRNMTVVMALIVGGLTLLALWVGPSTRSVIQSKFLLAATFLAVWIVIGSLMLRSMRRSTQRAFDDLLANAVAAADAAAKSIRQLQRPGV